MNSLKNKSKFTVIKDIQMKNNKGKDTHVEQMHNCIHILHTQMQPHATHTLAQLHTKTSLNMLTHSLTGAPQIEPICIFKKEAGVLCRSQCEETNTHVHTQMHTSAYTK